jgi:hypothetical protein
MTSASTVRSDLIAANVLESTLSVLVNRWGDISDFAEGVHFGAGVFRSARSADVNDDGDLI